MIESLAIRNFKSIKDLKIDCSKVNVFIGEPNTGKSNILEALGLLSWAGHTSFDNRIYDFIRYKIISNLFYDDLVENGIEIRYHNESGDAGIKLNYKDGEYHLRSIENKRNIASFMLNGQYHVNHHSPENRHIKFYRYKNELSERVEVSDYLLPPEGKNIFSILFSRKDMRNLIGQIFEKYGLKLVLKPQERIFEYQKSVDDIVISYPYELLSETLKRIIFYMLAIESNKDSTLVFEEPEAHAFPFYTKYLGERITLDTSNQYFIATHNPYLLRAIVEKSKTDDVRVFVTYYEDYRTRVKPLDDNGISEIMEFDPFLNIDHLIGR